MLEEQRAPLSLAVDGDAIRQIVTTIIQETLQALDWPAGRIALTEEEAARACGVGRHVLRDLRASGRLVTRKIGKRVVYLRQDLMDLLNDSDFIMKRGQK